MGRLHWEPGAQAEVWLPTALPQNWAAPPPCDRAGPSPRACHLRATEGLQVESGL